MNHQGTRVLIVEDESIIATDIRAILMRSGYQVLGHARSASRAMDILHTHSPDFALIDIYLGSGPSGLDVAEVIHQKYNIPYVFLTSFSDDQTILQAQEFGPYGYLVKPFQEQTLLSTISIALFNHKRSRQRSNTSYPYQYDTLTDQQKRVCDCLVQGMSYKQICENLFISENTLKFHVKNIYTIFDIHSRSELAHLFMYPHRKRSF